MKFINYLGDIDGVSIYPFITLLIFFGFFVALIIFVIRAKKEDMDHLSNMPFDEIEPVNPSQL
jgi:cbb3-type cytochrome oxidase subunit 3